MAARRPPDEHVTALILSGEPKEANGTPFLVLRLKLTAGPKAGSEVSATLLPDMDWIVADLENAKMLGDPVGLAIAYRRDGAGNVVMDPRTKQPGLNIVGMDGVPDPAGDDVPATAVAAAPAPAKPAAPARPAAAAPTRITASTRVTAVEVASRFVTSGWVSGEDFAETAAAVAVWIEQGGSLSVPFVKPVS